MALILQVLHLIFLAVAVKPFANGNSLPQEYSMDLVVRDMSPDVHVFPGLPDPGPGFNIPDWCRTLGGPATAVVGSFWMLPENYRAKFVHMGFDTALGAATGYGVCEAFREGTIVNGGITRRCTGIGMVFGGIFGYIRGYADLFLPLPANKPEDHSGTKSNSIDVNATNELVQVELVARRGLLTAMIEDDLRSRGLRFESVYTPSLDDRDETSVKTTALQIRGLGVDDGLGNSMLMDYHFDFHNIHPMGQVRIAKSQPIHERDYTTMPTIQGPGIKMSWNFTTFTPGTAVDQHAMNALSYNIGKAWESLSKWPPSSPQGFHVASPVILAIFGIWHTTQGGKCWPVFGDAGCSATTAPCFDTMLRASLH